MEDGGAKLQLVGGDLHTRSSKYVRTGPIELRYLLITSETEVSQRSIKDMDLLHVKTLGELGYR